MLEEMNDTGKALLNSDLELLECNLHQTRRCSKDCLPSLPQRKALRTQRQMQ